MNKSEILATIPFFSVQPMKRALAIVGIEVQRFLRAAPGGVEVLHFASGDEAHERGLQVARKPVFVFEDVRERIAVQPDRKSVV